MEILDTGGRDRRDDDHAGPRPRSVGLELGGGAGADPAEGTDVPSPSRWGRAVGAVACSEALGLAGLVVAAVAVGGTGMFLVQTVLGALNPEGFGDERGYATLGVRPVLLAGLLALALALAALARLPDPPTPAARTLAGSAAVVALVVTALGVWGTVLLESAP